MYWIKEVPVKFLGIILWYKLEIEHESYIDGFARMANFRIIDREPFLKIDLEAKNA